MSRVYQKAQRAGGARDTKRSHRPIRAWALFELLLDQPQLKKPLAVTSKVSERGAQGCQGGRGQQLEGCVGLTQVKERLGTVHPSKATADESLGSVPKPCMQQLRRNLPGCHTCKLQSCGNLLLFPLSLCCEFSVNTYAIVSLCPCWLRARWAYLRAPLWSCRPRQT